MLPISAVFQVADMLGDAFAPLREPLSVDQLIALARRRTGLSEFGETAFRIRCRSFCARVTRMEI